MTDAADIGRVVALMRVGRVEEAAATNARLLLEQGDRPALLQLAAMIAGQAGRYDDAASLFARALATEPGDLPTRVNLARALIAARAFDEAESVAAAGPSDSIDLLRLRAAAAHEGGRFAQAIEWYGRLLEAAPADAGVLNNYGNVLRSGGDAAGGVVALERAHALAPGDAAIAANLASALIDAGRVRDALPFAQIARLIAPIPVHVMLNARLLLALDCPADAIAALATATDATLSERAMLAVVRGQALAALGRHAEAENALRVALALEPVNGDALRTLAAQLEGENRADDVRALADAARLAGAATGDANFLDALVARRDGRFDAALALLGAAPSHASTLAELRLEGECADRTGDTARAWRCFAKVNQTVADGPMCPRKGAAVYRRELAETQARTTRAWLNDWTPNNAGFDQPAPVFLVGFPRSGTTLLDTVLMGHPDLAVLEEAPVLQRVAQAAGPLATLGQLDGGAISRLRQLYHDETRQLLPDIAGKTIIDKFPLHIARLPLIHRIFPEARFIFAERHPCDVVLSCFMTNFALNYAVANFLDLHDTAQLYDQVLGYWHQCHALMNMPVHLVRYETLVDDYETQVRAAVAFVGVEWTDRVLDHRRTAAERGRISAPSYAQVTEPIYRRATGRWRRYADELAPVMPILEPWIDRLGYRDD